MPSRLPGKAHRDDMLTRGGLVAKCHSIASVKLHEDPHIGYIGGQKKHARMKSSRSWSNATSFLSLVFCFVFVFLTERM